jgi:hypothetical protein
MDNKYLVVPQYGCLLPTCITRKETTKARTTLCSSLPLLRLRPVGDLASTVESASAAYFGITVAPHEYFDQTATGKFVDVRGVLHHRVMEEHADSHNGHESKGVAE